MYFVTRLLRSAGAIVRLRDWALVRVKLNDIILAPHAAVYSGRAQRERALARATACPVHYKTGKRTEHQLSRY